jgi:hypothetical protein
VRATLHVHLHVNVIVNVDVTSLMSATRRGPTLRSGPLLAADTSSWSSTGDVLDGGSETGTCCSEPAAASSGCATRPSASGSAALNLAEAVGRQGADRAQRFRIARGPSPEVDAALTLLGHRRACPSELRGQARELTVRLVSMLTRLVCSARS